MYEQSKITKFIISNSINSIENIDKGNEHLKKAQEYQKGRGLAVGIIFIILGIFLLLYDAIL
jgi:t-SNARE complex subunit (syntaxin)